MKVATRKLSALLREHTGAVPANAPDVDVLCYTYSPCQGGMCRFHLLSEVGQPWMSEAKAQLKTLLEKRKAHVETLELDHWPHYVEILVKDSP